MNLHRSKRHLEIYPIGMELSHCSSLIILSVDLLGPHVHIKKHHKTDKNSGARALDI